MKGKELIEWIKDCNAEEYEVVVQYRDDGGAYSGGEIAEPTLATYKPRANDIVDILYHMGLDTNCIVL